MDPDDKDEKKKNLFVLPGGGNPNVSQEGLRIMREQMPVMMEFFEIQAKLRRAKFDALKKEGFTDEQAVEFCRAIFY